MTQDHDRNTGSASATTDAPALDDRTRTELENRLLEERKRAVDQVDERLEKEDTPPADDSGDLSHTPSHMADAASHAEQEHRDFRVAEKSSNRVTRIDAALTRLREAPAEFGRCQKCRNVIGEERLQLVPWTVFCADHAEARETPDRA